MGGVSFTLDSEKKHFIMAYARISLIIQVSSLKIVINLPMTYEKIPPERRTIAVQQLARSFLTDRQTDKHKNILLLYYKGLPVQL